jgi:hypothetical protein
MQEDTNAEESIPITPATLNMTKAKLIATLEHICYFHEMGFRSRLFEASDRDPQPNIEMTILELWNKCRGLENQKNTPGGNRQTSFRLLNSAMKTEPEQQNQALTEHVSKIQWLIEKSLKICTDGKERDEMTELMNSESRINYTSQQSLECICHLASKVTSSPTNPLISRPLELEHKTAQNSTITREDNYLESGVITLLSR